MRAKAIPFPWRENALALAMGLAIIGFGASPAHSASKTTASPPPAAVAQPARQQAAAPDFICHAPPGAWCDLRDWRRVGGETLSRESLR